MTQPAEPTREKGASSMTFIVITGHIVGNPQSGYETLWTSDMEEKSTYAAVKKHGLRSCGSDDFRIGALVGRKLVKLTWMQEVEFEQDEVVEAAKQLDLEADPAPPPEPGREAR